MLLVTGFCSAFIQNPSWAFKDPSTHSDFDKINKNLQCISVPEFKEQKIKMNFVKQWSAFVAKKSFTLPFENTEDYLNNIRPCFTEDGWTAYTEALNNSKNIQLIQEKQLKASSQVIGLVSVSHEEFTQIWETNVPMTLIYQNKKQKLIQELVIHLRLRERANNQLQVEQIIGFPKNTRVS
jgi:hypothetical protein